MNLNDKTAVRLKADQRRFMDRQSERLKRLGIHPAFTVSSVTFGSQIKSRTGTATSRTSSMRSGRSLRKTVASS